MTDADADKYGLSIAERFAGRPKLGYSAQELAHCVKELLRLVPPGPPGASLDERWASSNMDAYVIANCGSPEGVNRRGAQNVRFGARALYASGAVRPGLWLVLCAKSSDLAVNTRATGDDPEVEEIIEGSRAFRPAVDSSDEDTVRHTLLGLKMAFGRNISELTIDDWRKAGGERKLMRGSSVSVPVDAFPIDVVGPFADHRLRGLGRPYGWTRAAGLLRDDRAALPPGMVSTPATFADLMRPAVTISTLLKRADGVVPPKVLKILELTLHRQCSSDDMSTIAERIDTFVAYYRALNAVLGYHDSLDVPADKVHDIFTLLAFVPTKDGQRARQGLGTKLRGIRNLYDHIAKAAHDAPAIFAGLESASPGVLCPFGDKVINDARAEEMTRRRARHAVEVEANLEALDGLTDVAVRMLDCGANFVDLARAAGTGEPFAVGCETWHRKTEDGPVAADGLPEPLVSRTGAPSTYIRASLAGLKLARDACIWLLSRYTGARTQELARADRATLTTKRGAHGGAIAALVIAESKSGHGRDLWLPPEALDALDVLIGLTVAYYGTIPCSPRYDEYEHITEPPRELFFQSFGAPDLHGLSLTSIRTMMGHVAEWQKAYLGFDPPHHMYALANRRGRATELNRRDGDIRMIQQVLGHDNLATTRIYTFEDQAALVSAFLNVTQPNKGSSPALISDTSSGADDVRVDPAAVWQLDFSSAVKLDDERFFPGIPPDGDAS